MQLLLEEKETALTDADSKIDNLDRETACLRAKVRRLESEVDFITTDCYTLVREKITLENRLQDFNSWPEFRIEFGQLTTEFIAMKMQRAREHVLQERYLEIAREARVELAVAKQERDEAMEKYRILRAKTTTTTFTAAPAAVTATTSPVANAVAAIPVVKENSPGDIALKAENTRLTLALRPQSSFLSQKYSDLGRLQSRLKTSSENSVVQLNRASSTITSLEEDKAKAEGRIAELGRNLQEAKAKAEVRIAELGRGLQEAKDRADEMEEMYRAEAFASEGEGEKVEAEEKEEEEEGSGGEKAETSWVVEMSKKGPTGGSGADGSEGED